MNYKKGTIKRVHVDKRIMASNLKHGRNDPPITIQTSLGPKKFKSVEILGPSKVIYSPNKPLSCGARLWVETREEINAT